MEIATFTKPNRKKIEKKKLKRNTYEQAGSTKRPPNRVYKLIREKINSGQARITRIRMREGATSRWAENIWLRDEQEVYAHHRPYLYICICAASRFRARIFGFFLSFGFQFFALPSRLPFTLQFSHSTTLSSRSFFYLGRPLLLLLIKYAARFTHFVHLLLYISMEAVPLCRVVTCYNIVTNGWYEAVGYFVTLASKSMQDHVFFLSIYWFNFSVAHHTEHTENTRRDILLFYLPQFCVFASIWCMRCGADGKIKMDVVNELHVNNEMELIGKWKIFTCT